MEVRVFELAGGKLSIRELTWNEEVRAHFRIINDKVGRSEVAEFQVSTKQRFNRPSALEELINHLKAIQSRADTRQPQDAEPESPAPSRPAAAYEGSGSRPAYAARNRQHYSSRGSYPSRNFMRGRGATYPPDQQPSPDESSEEPNFNQ